MKTFFLAILLFAYCEESTKKIEEEVVRFSIVHLEFNFFNNLIFVDLKFFYQVGEIQDYVSRNKTETVYQNHAEFTMIVGKGASECMFIETESDGNVKFFKYLIENF